VTEEGKTKKTGGVLVLIVIGLVALLGLMCFLNGAMSGGSRSTTSSSSSSSRASSYEVRYEVYTPMSVLKAGLTYRNASGNTEQQDVNLNWRTSFTAEPGQFLYISAQADERNSTIG